MGELKLRSASVTDHRGQLWCMRFILYQVICNIRKRKKGDAPTTDSIFQVSRFSPIYCSCSLIVSLQGTHLLLAFQFNISVRLFSSISFLSSFCLKHSLIPFVLLIESGDTKLERRNVGEQWICLLLSLTSAECECTFLLHVSFNRFISKLNYFAPS